MVPNNNQFGMSSPPIQQMYQIQQQKNNFSNQNMNNRMQEMMTKKANLLKQQQNMKTLNSNSSVFIPNQLGVGGQTQPQLNQINQFNQNGKNIPNPISPNSQQVVVKPNRPPSSQQQTMPSQQDEQEFIQLILQLRNEKFREEALIELQKRKESYQDLAPMIWYSSGTVAILLQEILTVFNFLNPQQLTIQMSNRVCSVLGILQCIALHPKTRIQFLKAHIPMFLYPLLNTTSNKAKPFENIRVTSLGVIGALVKGDDSEIITFLMQTEIIPLCLKIMKKDQSLSRTVATFVVQKILLDDNGLDYICHTAERFYAVASVLQNMIEELSKSSNPDQRLLRHIIKCYSRLAENKKARESLKQCLPKVLQDSNNNLIKDEVVKRWHEELLININMILKKNNNITN